MTIRRERAGESRETSYGYDICNRVSSVKSPSGETVEYTYNSLGQITGVPGITAGNIAYDDNTYLSGYTFKNGMELSRSYDGKKRVTDISYILNGEELERYNLRYDIEDNIIEKSGDYFSYDGKNRIISESLAGKAAASEYDFDGEYDGMIADLDVLGQKAMFLSEDDFSLDWGARSLGIDLGYGYRVGTLILNPVSSTHRIDGSKIELYTSLSNWEDQYGEKTPFTYEEKEDGTIVLKLNGKNGVFTRYIKLHCHYNELNEDGKPVKEASTFSLNEEAPYRIMVMTGVRNRFYVYDDKDNRRSVGTYVKEMDTDEYSFYPGSDLVRTVSNGRDNRTAYRYDANGNMTEKGDYYTENGDEVIIETSGEYYRYEYDMQNRLKHVYRWNHTAGKVERIRSYTYNAAGLRVLTESNDGETVSYSFDTGGKMLERREADAVRTYVYLGSKVLAHREEGKTVYYGTDHIGSTMLMTDENGEVVWTGEVTPFADSESTSDDSEHVMFTGKQLDEATGLYYFNARWYDPSLGRFTTEDPIRDGLNWYIYANNNPLKYVDPTGLEGNLYIYSHDISGPGESWEYTFFEGALAEAAKNGDMGLPSTPRAYKGVSNRTEFQKAIEEFYSEHGTIDNLTVVTHMSSTEIKLDSDSSNGRERFVRASDLEGIDAEISNVKLSGCNAGAEVIDGKNIAQEFAAEFDAVVTASTSGTWFNDNQGVTNGPFDRDLIALEPRGGEWKEF